MERGLVKVLNKQYRCIFLYDIYKFHSFKQYIRRCIDGGLRSFSVGDFEGFLNLNPKCFIHLAKLKALQIRKRKQSQTSIHIPSNIIKLPYKHTILSSNSSTNFIENDLSNLGIKAVILSSSTIRDLLDTKYRQHIKSNAGIYSIPWKDYKKRLYEHKRDITLGNFNDALFLHMIKTNHNFNFNAAAMLAHIHNKFLKLVQFCFYPPFTHNWGFSVYIYIYIYIYREREMTLFLLLGKNNNFSVLQDSLQLLN